MLAYFRRLPLEGSLDSPSQFAQIPAIVPFTISHSLQISIFFHSMSSLILCHEYIPHFDGTSY